MNLSTAETSIWIDKQLILTTCLFKRSTATICFSAWQPSQSWLSLSQFFPHLEPHSFYTSVFWCVTIGLSNVVHDVDDDDDDDDPVRSQMIKENYPQSKHI